ncbi:MAG TPA: nitrogenase component 1, partial [Negativicutes bacterium]|nr:nitrogenase component 1 [Negativicutes bacterium]
MGLHRFKPPMSGRMGTLWTLASIRDAALIEYGCMGHMLYGRVFLHQAGIWEACKLYSTHIDETDISLGDTGRLNRAIAEIIRRDKPKMVFLLPSSIPTVIGTDLPAVCEELQPAYRDVRLIPFGCGGFDICGHRGVQEALLLLAKTLPVDRKKTPLPTFNIIGSCADLFRFHADAEELVRIMAGTFGMQPLCVMTSDTSVGQME